MKRLRLVLATAGGAGYAPIAPGTAGSVVGVLVYLSVQSWSAAAQLSLLAAVTVVGVWAAHAGADHFGREDPGQVVIDEVAGQLLTLLATGASGWGIALGFFLFRAMDIVKPWPARGLERLPRGYGIMADDLMAALYGHLLLRLAQLVGPGIF
jgi:phosphatidylglycerophosphatase A